MRPEDVRHRMRVIVTKGYYKGNIGRVVQPSNHFSDKYVVWLYTEGNSWLSRFWNVWHGQEITFSAEDFEPL